MSCKIRVLDEQTINQIAAGEVIQNPSSVVKELVENSIDAGANEICVEISSGGRQLIRITDNGCGMSADDALLCLERHATSKIKDLNDVYSLGTMGFRGEAIPSIASISKFMLLTRTTHSEAGTLVMVEGGRIIQCVEAACNVGTTIEVKSLFYNVPVRKKFQRSPIYDTQEITKVLMALALGNPFIKFELISNQEIIFATPSNTGEFLEVLQERAALLLGEEYRTSACNVDLSEGEISIKGVIGLPHTSRHNRTGQHLFLNRRCVYSPLVALAVREGFGTTLHANRHPIYVLHIDLPGNLVDVNIHPQKKEVKLRRDAELRALIFKAIDKALQGKGITFGFEIAPAAPSILPPINFEVEQIKTAFIMPDLSQVYTFEEKEETRELFQEVPKIRIPKIIATLPCYLLLEDDEGLKLLDQKAAQSRILFERLMLKDKGKREIGVQTLLIPITFEVNMQEEESVKANIDNLASLGIQVQEFGPRTFIVNSLPQSMNSEDIGIFIIELAQQLDNFEEGLTYAQKNEKKLAYAANRASMRFNRKLNTVEAHGLLEQLFACQTTAICPLGNQIILTLTPLEIARFFQK